MGLRSRDLDRTLAALAARPWALVRCWPRSKKPAARKDEPWPVTTDPGRVRAHLLGGGNVGLVAGQPPGVAIVDSDNLEEWALLVKAHGELGAAWVETGSGKVHYYVAWEPDLPAKLISLDGEIIGEIQRGPGQQHCLIPPSVHPATGRPYRWLVADPATEPLRPLPDAWRTWLRRPRALPARTPRSSAPPAAHVSDRVAMAMAQPGAVRRASGVVKFACPACRAEGFDEPGDNAALFPGGRWGCAWASGTSLGRQHWEAIGVALGVLRSRLVGWS